MKVFKFLPPYKPTGKTTFPETKNRTGVYLIKKNGILVYVGYEKALIIKHKPKDNKLKYQAYIKEPKGVIYG